MYFKLLDLSWILCLHIKSWFLHEKYVLSASVNCNIASVFSDCFIKIKSRFDCAIYLGAARTCHFWLIYMPNEMCAPPHLKGTQVWDNFEFFLPKSNPSMPSVNFRKKIRFFSSIFARISMFEHFRGDWAYAEPNIFDDLSKNFFFLKIFTLVLLDGFLDGFWKFWLFIVKICILIWHFWVFFENYSMRMLSICGNDFTACSAYA